ncbi:MAG: hypothetical protein ACK4S2_13695 [Gemmobacter sp.]|uniref:hypothetical protein n=1 Tax=Gemmobacter sp. TaxID=1898957 RepID=UPI00391AF53B
MIVPAVFRRLIWVIVMANLNWTGSFSKNLLAARNWAPVKAPGAGDTLNMTFSAPRR